MILATDSPSCALNRPAATALVTAEIASIRFAAVATGGSLKRLFGAFARGNKRSMHNRMAVGSDFNA